MATKVNPPFSEAVVEIPDEKVDVYKAAGWTVVKEPVKRAKKSEGDK